jgi:tetratricopeptide (TPR) repeat protein
MAADDSYGALPLTGSASWPKCGERTTLGRRRRCVDLSTIGVTAPVKLTPTDAELGVRRIVRCGRQFARRDDRPRVREAPIQGRRFPTLRKLLVATVVVVVTVLAVDYLLRQLDPRLYPVSTTGLRAFAKYLAGDYAAAARLYRADLADRVPPDAPPWFGTYLFGDLKTAEQLIRRDLEKAPSNADDLISLAEIALAARRLPDALELSGRALALRRDDYDALLIAAVAHSRRGDAGAALEALNRALRYNRIERRPTVFLATLELTGDLDDDPRSSPCLLATLHRYLRIFDPSHARPAERYARSAIAAGDHVDQAYVTLGVVFEKTGRRRYALEAFSGAIAVNPRNLHALLGAARQHAHRGEIAEEYRRTRQAVEAAPHDAFVLNGYHGLLTGKLGDYPAALALDRAAVAANPADSEAWWRLGTVQSYLGDHGAALTAHRRAATLAPDDPEFHDAVANALVTLGRLDEAQAIYQASIKLQPARPTPHTGLGTIHAKRERWQEARREYERAFELGESNVEMLVNLCQVYQALLDNQRAVNCLSAVLTHDPDNVRARVLLEHAGAALALEK